jgi:transposase-like protein
LFSAERRDSMRRSRRRVRRSETEWREILARYEESGLSRVEFCQREGMARTTLEKWSRKLSSSGVPARFVELVPPRLSPTLAEGAWAVELELPSGAVLRIRG